MEAVFQHGDPISVARHSDPMPDRSRQAASALLKDMAFRTPPCVQVWTRACAMEMIVKLKLTDCLDNWMEALKDKDDFIRELAVWALLELHPETYEKYAEKFKIDHSPRVSGLAKQIENSGK
jgi:HEAT repeat protein